MSATLHLTVTTPAIVLADINDVMSVRAEDGSGCFGILPGHADLLTTLAPSIVRWQTSSGTALFCAVRGGVLTVSQGRRVAIACREAVIGDAMKTLEAKVRDLRAQQADANRRAHVERIRMHASAVRQLVRYLRPAPAQHAGTPSGIGEVAS